MGNGWTSDFSENDNRPMLRPRVAKSHFLFSETVPSPKKYRSEWTAVKHWKAYLWSKNCPGNFCMKHRQSKLLPLRCRGHGSKPRQTISSEAIGDCQIRISLQIRACVLSINHLPIWDFLLFLNLSITSCWLTQLIKDGYCFLVCKLSSHSRHLTERHVLYHPY